MAKRNRARQEQAAYTAPASLATTQDERVFGDRIKQVAASEVAYLLAGLGNDSVSQPFSNNSLNWTNGITLPQLPGVNKLVTPKPEQYDIQMHWAKHARDVSIVNGPLARRLDFIISGFRHKHHESKIVKFYDRLAKKAKLAKALKAITWEYITVGWVMVMPDTMNLEPYAPNGQTAIHLLHDGVKNEPAFGIDNFYIEIDSIMAHNIRLNEKNFPSYIVKAINRPGFNGRVPLEDNYFVAGMRGINQPFPRSPMFPLFEPLKTIENLVETQFAISFAIKQLMLHVKVSGGKDQNGIERSPSLKQLQGAARQVFDGARVSTIITSNTTDLQFVSPEKDIFEATDKPYQRAMERIERGVRIPMLLVDGRLDGASYSTASIVIKAFLQSVRADRRTVLDDFVYPWYERKAKEYYESDPKKYAFLMDEDGDAILPQLIFDESELRNINELIALARFKHQTGAYSIESIMDMFQDDIETEKRKKEAQNKDDNWIYLNWEANQGAAEALLDHQSEEKEADREAQERLSKEQQKTQVKISKSRPVSGGSRPGKAAPGSPGRPSSPTSRPRSDTTDRNPRAGGPSPSAQANRSTNDVLTVLNERAMRFFKRLSGASED